MRLYFIKIIILILILDLVLSDPKTKTLKKSLRTKKNKSTSSDSQSGSEAGSESLDVSSSGSSRSASKVKSDKQNVKHRPRSTEERTGWRKWHRKCTPCPEDMRKKWRDPSISWICGGYQRARRSFKSSCMMRYRNCQDGTMFVKIHDGKCKNDTGNDVRNHGDHFLYDYTVEVSNESSNSAASSSSGLDSK